MNAELGRALKCWLDAGLGFFYPEVCQSCGKERATADEGYVGPGCWQSIQFIRRPFCERCGLPFEGALSTAFECANCKEMELHFCQARSAVAARGMVLDIIHRYKYQRALWFEPFLADLLAREAGPDLRPEAWDMITPVPLHPLKKSEREFNQADRLARPLSEITRIPLHSRLLRRVMPTRTQTLLSRAERTANVRRAFALQDPSAVKGKSIVLVDDVLTTGATTSACARVLKAGGALRVKVWTVARGLIN